MLIFKRLYQKIKDSKSDFAKFVMEVMADKQSKKGAVSPGSVVIGSNAATHIMDKEPESRIRLTQELLKAAFGITSGNGSFAGLDGFIMILNSQQVKCWPISNDIVDQLRRQLQCNLNDLSNVDRILKSFEAAGRHGSESVIDADKHAEIVIDDNMLIKNVRCTSSYRLSTSFDGFGRLSSAPIKFYRAVDCADRGFSGFYYRKNSRGKVLCASYNDTQSDIQWDGIDVLASRLEELRSSFKEVKIESDTLNKFNIGTTDICFGDDLFSEVRKLLSVLDNRYRTEKGKLQRELDNKVINTQVYAKELSNLTFVYKNKIAELNNTTRFYCLGLPLAEAGKHLVYASNIKWQDGSMKLDDKSTNRTCFRIMPEATLAFFTQDDTKGVGYKLSGSRKVLEELVGCNVTFVNGISNDYGIQMSDYYGTGIYTIEKNKDGFFATTDMKIKSIPVRTPSTLDILCFNYTSVEAIIKDEEFGSSPLDDNDIDGYDKLICVPKFIYNGTAMYNVVVGYIGKEALPVCNYSCKSARMHSVLDYCVLNNPRVSDLGGYSTSFYITFSYGEYDYGMSISSNNNSSNNNNNNNNNSNSGNKSNTSYALPEIGTNIESDNMNSLIDSEEDYDDPDDYNEDQLEDEDWED